MQAPRLQRFRQSVPTLAILFVAGLAQTTMARDLVVPTDFPTITEAIDAAEDFDTIFLKSGRYDETINVTRKNLQIVGTGNTPLDTTILCNGRLHTVNGWRNDAKVKFNNLTFLKEQTKADGSIRVTRSLVEFRNCHFIGLGNRGGCHWGRGGHSSTGAMYLDRSQVDVIDCRFLANTAETACDRLAIASGGAIYALHTDLRVIRSSFMGNEVRAAATGGRPVDEDDYATGGAISCFRGKLQIKDSVFRANRAWNAGRQRHFGMARGGAVHVWDSFPVLIEGNTFEGNRAEWDEESANEEGTCSGGAIWILTNVQVLTDNTYTGNSSDQSAGAVYSQGGEITDSRFECNLPTHLDGWNQERNNRFFDCPEPCPADLNGDGRVDVQDMMELFDHWGPVDEDNPADLDGSGSVDMQDLLLVLAAIGNC